MTTVMRCVAGGLLPVAIPEEKRMSDMSSGASEPVQPMFLDCPAFLDRDLTVRCGLPAEVMRRFTMRSTDGLLESAMIRCPAGHHFNAPIPFLTWNSKDKNDPGATPAGSRAGRDSQDGREGREDSTGSSVRGYRAKPVPGISRPNTAPAYYLGHSAHVWITVMRPRWQTTYDQRTQAVTDRGQPAPSRHAGQVIGTGAETACATIMASR